MFSKERVCNNTLVLISLLLRSLLLFDGVLYFVCNCKRNVYRCIVYCTVVCIGRCCAQVLAPIAEPEEADRHQVLASRTQHDYAAHHQTLQAAACPLLVYFGFFHDDKTDPLTTIHKDFIFVER